VRQDSTGRESPRRGAASARSPGRRREQIDAVYEKAGLGKHGKPDRGLKERALPGEEF